MPSKVGATEYTKPCRFNVHISSYLLLELATRPKRALHVYTPWPMGTASFGQHNPIREPQETCLFKKMETQRWEMMLSSSFNVSHLEVCTKPASFCQPCLFQDHSRLVRSLYRTGSFAQPFSAEATAASRTWIRF